MNIFSKKMCLYWLCTAVLLVANSVFAQDPAPETLTQSVTYNGQTITLRMVKDSVRGPNFEVLVQNAQGGYDAWQPGEVRTYIGTVDERPDAYAAGILLVDGKFKARVNFDRGATWWTLGSTVTGTHGTGSTTYNIPSLPSVTPGKAGANTYSFGVGFDSDYQYYKRRGTVAGCFQMMEFTAISVRAQYLQNVKLMPELGRVIIRPYQSKCPYEGVGGNLLYEFRTHWNTQHPVSVAPRDTAALVTPTIGGGLAWVGVIGGSFAYSLNGMRTDGSFDGVWRHEMGHNWGARDYHADSPEGPTMMCGNQYARFNGPAVETIFDHRDSRIARFTNRGTYSKVNLPPYAAMDFVDGINVGQSVAIDVLANDFDVNTHALSLHNFESASDQGGTITLSASTGTGGRDELIYTAPTKVSDAKDYFHYTIADSAGARSTGVVILSVSTTITITAQPVDVAVSAGERVLITITAVNPFTGNDTGLSYQWKYSPDGVTYSDVTGGTSSTFSLAAAQVSDQGYYRCDVTLDSNGQTVSSEIAQLIVKQVLAHWTMDQVDYVGGRYVDIAGDHNATPNTAPTFTAGAGPEMPAAGAAVINPDSFAANVGTWNPLETTGQITISTWLKWNGDTTNISGGYEILSKSSGWELDVSMWNLKLRSVSGGKAGIWFYNKTNSLIRTNGLIPADTWTHVCATYGSSVARLYIDGELAVEKTNAAMGTGTDSTLKLGGTSASNAFPGAMDEVMVLNYLASKEDAAALYYQTSRESICLYPPAVDFNDDCKTDLKDFAILAGHWLECGKVPHCQ